MEIYHGLSPATSIPFELTAWDQWVCWRHQDGKKPPVDLRGKNFDWTDSTRWLPYANAIAAMQEHSYDGVGFVLTPDDPFSIIDLDGVRDPTTGEIEPWAMEIVGQIGTYTEVSPSGKGLHIIVRGKLPGVGKKGGTPIELFVSSGYVTITGNTLPGYETIHDRQKELEQFYDVHIRRDMPVSEPPAPSVGSSTLSAFEVLEKARNGQVLGSKFKALEAGDISVSKNDAHVADKDFMMQLAYYTGKDPRLMEQLFSESVLGLREKWTDRPDYRRDTIDYAIKHTHGVYDSNSPNETKVRDKIREELHYALLSHDWSGRADAAATDYFGYKAILRMAYKANSLEIDVSLRDYQQKASIANRDTAIKSLARLEDKHGLVKKVRDGDHETPARYRIRAGSKVDHTKIWETPVRITYGPGLIPLVGTHLIRNSSPQMPDYDKKGQRIPAREAPLVTSVGKSAAMGLDILHAAQQVLNGPVPLLFLADRLGISQKNLKARQIKKLLSAHLLEQSENGYRTPDDIQARLQQELLMTGSCSAAKFQRSRHDKDRRAQTIKRLSWSGKNRYEILHETGYEWHEIAALVPEVVDTYPEPSDEHIDTLERQPVFHIVRTEDNLVYLVTPPSEPDPNAEPCIHSDPLFGHYPGGRGCFLCDTQYPGRHEIIMLDERRRIDWPGRKAA